MDKLARQCTPRGGRGSSKSPDRPEIDTDEDSEDSQSESPLSAGVVASLAGLSVEKKDVEVLVSASKSKQRPRSRGRMAPVGWAQRGPRPAYFATPISR